MVGRIMYQDLGERKAPHQNTEIRTIFSNVKKLVNAVEKDWSEWGPGSIKDPTNGGIGHIKKSAESMSVISEERRFAQIRCDWWKLYTKVSPIYQDTESGIYRFIEMNKGEYNPLYHDWLIPLNRSRKVFLYGK